jgi:hypothetical protein
MKLKRLVPAGTPPRKAGEIDAQAGMPTHEKRKDRASARVGSTATTRARTGTAERDKLRMLASISTDICFWHKADIRLTPANVRFWE